MHLSHTAWFTAAYSPVMTMTEQRSGRSGDATRW